MKITIKEIAKLAGVSPATISRVVNKSGYVKDEVRAKVEKIIEETGYKPNPFAKALLQNKSNTIGVILPKINSTSSGDTVAGIDEFISEKGYTILIGNSSHSIEKEMEIFEIFQEKMVDGIILIATELTAKHKKMIKNSKIPTVILGQDSGNSIPCVVFDNYVAARELASYLVESGKREVAFIGVGAYDVAVGIDRKKGFLDVMEENEIELEENYMQEGNFTVDSGYEACRKIMKKAKPKAIMAVTDKMAVGAMSYLFEKGYKVPEDISVVGMGGGDLSKYFHPKLTTVEYDYKNLGFEGAKLLYDIINENGRNTRKIVMNHKLIKRESSK